MKYFTSTEKATGLLPINECFAVSKTANLEVTVKPGGVMINGITAFEDNETKFTISSADTLDRIDTVVVRLLDNIPHEEVDVISGDIPSSMGDALKYKQSAYKSRDFEIAVVKGTPSETPKAPELRRDDRVYELGVANVHVSGVSISEVTDTRYDDTRCGLADSIISELLNRAGGSEDGFKITFGAVHPTSNRSFTKGNYTNIQLVRADPIYDSINIGGVDRKMRAKNMLPEGAIVYAIIPCASLDKEYLYYEPETTYSPDTFKGSNIYSGVSGLTLTPNRGLNTSCSMSGLCVADNLSINKTHILPVMYIYK